MRQLCLRTLLLVFLVAFAGCANFIRDEQAVIWDRVPETDSLRLDDLDFDGAVVSARLRYFCERRQYNVTQIYETPYVGKNELYEVPVGIVGTAVGMVWYILAEVVTLGAADNEVSTSVLDWGAAGLNPFLPVENGMFAERWEVHVDEETRQPLPGGVQEPYDAVVPIESSHVLVRFASAGSPAGEPIELPATRNYRFELSLLDASPVITDETAQKVLVDAQVSWTEDAEPDAVSFHFFIEQELAERLHEAREHVETLLTSDDFAVRADALEALNQLGFSREAAMILDRQL